MKFIIKANRISEAIFFLSLIYTPIYQNNFFEVIKVRFNVLEKKIEGYNFGTKNTLHLNIFRKIA